ncbi:hypothetical protein P4E94_02415 [Pontiellaceae bacterium B12219]|nr:hypothetical protein [Pontiellaceae bacterium B12219]
MIKQLITMVAVVGIAAATQAGIATEFTVDDDSHILDGAVLSTYIDGADTWTESVGSPGVFGAVGSNATLTISNASGAGAAWNGVYTYYNGTGQGPFVGAYQDSGDSYGTVGLTPDQEAAVPYWENGTGNQLYFLLGLATGTTAASDGAAVVQDNFGGLKQLYLESPSFGTPVGGLGSITVIPEPGTISLMSLSTVGLFLTRTLRRRKRLGRTMMPIRRVPLCDSFLSEAEWRSEADQIEELGTEESVIAQFTVAVKGRYVAVSTKYRELEKAFWNRMVMRYENRLEKRSVRFVRLKKGATHYLDEFLAMIMK